MAETAAPTKRLTISRISRIGVELEGGWNDRPAGLYGDGSVGGLSGLCRYSGEIASPPGTLSTVINYIKRFYPAAVNNTCGFHIHTSFRRELDYARLADKKFWEYFLDMMQTWGRKQQFDSAHEFWKRLSGANQFCKKEFIPHRQIKLTSKGHERYTLLNYCYNLHRTIECRLYPMFGHSDLAVEALRHLVTLYEEWLKKCPSEEWVKYAVTMPVIEKPGHAFDFKSDVKNGYSLKMAYVIDKSERLSPVRAGRAAD